MILNLVTLLAAARQECRLSCDDSSFIGKKAPTGRNVLHLAIYFSKPENTKYFPLPCFLPVSNTGKKPLPGQGRRGAAGIAPFGGNH